MRCDLVTPISVFQYKSEISMSQAALSVSHTHGGETVIGEAGTNISDISDI
jgi:hypothetical protein